MSDDDQAFASLSLRMRNKIDHAFDKASSNFSNSMSLDSNATPGGFIGSDDAAAPGGFLLDAPGGFLPPSPSDLGGAPPSPPTDSLLPVSLTQSTNVERSPDDVILLSEIPLALQILDLPPDDEEIMAVFRNAATGWGASGPEAEGGEQQGNVLRRDWRAVCCALMGDGDGSMNSGSDEPEEVDVSISNEEEVMPMDVDEPDDDGSSDEYIEETTQPKRKRGAPAPKSKRQTRRKKADSATESDDDPLSRPLTARQKRECLHAFSLFFPDLDESALKRCRIGIKELSQTSNLLKEKTSVEEMVEMLEMFSSTPDKTMGLSDFEKMMVLTRMV